MLVSFETDLQRMRHETVSKVPKHQGHVHADVPLPNSRNQAVRVLRKSGFPRKVLRIAILVVAQSSGMLTTSGSSFLESLLDHSSILELTRGAQLAEELTKSDLQNNKYYIVYANTSFQRSIRRPKAPRRIGVGYRDKGTLANDSSKARRISDSESWLYLNPNWVNSFVEDYVLYNSRYSPLVVEGPWHLYSVEDYWKLASFLYTSS